jgi:(p)ppGpp synthase/HD superfamily hydrolase
MNNVEKIRWIVGQHDGQKYGDQNHDYSYHLYQVNGILAAAISNTISEILLLDPSNQDVFDSLRDYDEFEKSKKLETLLLAALGHDVIEDTTNTYNDVKQVLGEEVADIIYDVTNELGKNRKERAIKTYPKIRKNPDAILVKLADRIANTKHSKETDSGMFKKYKQEYPEFRLNLFNGAKCHPNEFLDMVTCRLWIELDSLNLLSF